MDNFNVDLNFDRKVILSMGEILCLGTNAGEESSTALCLFLSPTYLQLVHTSTRQQKRAKAGKADSL